MVGVFDPLEICQMLLECDVTARHVAVSSYQLDKEAK